MAVDKKLIKRILAIALIILGIAFGFTWGSTGACFGDKMFSALGLPVWSNGAEGTHYPAVVGMIMALMGIGVFNTTLSRKARFWVWGIAVVIFLIFAFVFPFL